MFSRIQSQPMAHAQLAAASHWLLRDCDEGGCTVDVQVIFRSSGSIGARLAAITAREHAFLLSSSIWALKTCRAGSRAVPVSLGGAKGPVYFEAPRLVERTMMTRRARSMTENVERDEKEENDWTICKEKGAAICGEF